MNVKLLVELSEELKIASSTFYVEQANVKAIYNQQSYCRLYGNIVKALVPANIQSVTSQESENSFLMLAACYESCINVAASAGATQILIKPLGVGIPITKISENGEVANVGLWGNLFWTHSKSSLAARKAVENVRFIIPDDVTTVFVIPKEHVEEWDWIFMLCEKEENL
jgi:hypothetical protein